MLALALALTLRPVVTQRSMTQGATRTSAAHDVGSKLALSLELFAHAYALAQAFASANV